MRIFIIIGFLLCCMISEAQQKKQNQKAKSPLSDIENLMQSADKLFKQGEYIKASRLYDICAGMYESESPRAKEQKKKCQQLFKLQEDAFFQFTKKNYTQAIAIYDELLAINPNDITAINFRKNVLEVQRTPPVNDLETLLNKADDLFQKGHLSDARILYQIVISAPEKYKTPLAQAKIHEIDQINTGIKGYTLLAVQNPKKAKEFLEQAKSKYGDSWGPIIIVEDDYVRLRRAFLALVNSADKMFTEGYYDNALANYQKALKIPHFSNLIRGKSRILNCESIIRRKEQNAQLISDPGKHSTIVGNFDFILNLNYKDSITRNDYYDYIKKDLIAADKYNDCDKIKLTIVKLTLIHENRSSGENIDSFTSDCDEKAKCFVIINTFRGNLKEIGSYIFNARTTEDLLNAETNLKKLQSDCNTNAQCLPDSLCKALKDTLAYTQKKLQKQQCIVKADDLLTRSDSLFTLNSCKEAMNVLKKIDTTCLIGNSIKLYKTALQRSTKCFKLEMYNLYMDSTYKQISKKYQKDVARLLDSALVYAPDSIARRKVNCMKYPENCKSVMKEKEICTDTARSAGKIEFVFGINPLTTISEIGIIPLNGQLIHPELNSNVLLGARYNFIRYRKHIDFPIGIYFNTIEANVSSTTLANKFVTGDLNIKMVEIIPELKWHTIAPCPDKARFMITAGLTGGYSWASSVSKDLIFVDEFKTALQQPIVGFLGSIGFDIPKPKKFGFEAAIFYSRKGSLYDHESKSLTSPFKAQAYYTLIGIKVGLRLW